MESQYSMFLGNNCLICVDMPHIGTYLDCPNYQANKEKQVCDNLHPKRLRRVNFNMHNLIKMLTEGTFTALKCAQGLPPDAVYMGTVSTGRIDYIGIIFHHEDWKICSDEYMCPEILTFLHP